MASNNVPNAQPIRLRLANSEIAGLALYQTEIGLSVVTDAVLNAKIVAFQGADSAILSANTDKSAKQAALNVARDAGYALAAVVKRFVTDLPGFGTSPNAQWEERGSLQIERKTVEVLLQKMSVYLDNHGADQSPARGVTQDNCADKMNAIITARGELDAAKATYAGLRTTEEAAFKALGVTMGDLVRELKLHLSGDDPRWYGFGLRRPDDTETPSQPHDLTLSLAGENRVFANWDDVPGADHYNVYLAQNSQPPVRFGRADDSELMLDNLIVGTTIKVHVVASNAGGESVPSDVATIVVI